MKGVWLKRKIEKQRKAYAAKVLAVIDEVNTCVLCQAFREKIPNLVLMSYLGLERVMVGISRGIIRAKGEEMLQYGQRKPFKRDRWLRKI